MRWLACTGLAVALVLTAAPALAHDGHEGSIGPSEIVTTLKTAHDQWHGAGGTAAARATLATLSGRLAADPTPYNQWVQRKVNAIVLAIDGGQIVDGENQLHELISVLSRPPLTRAVLKARCVEFHDILHGQQPDAAQRCASAVRAYNTSLAADTSALSQWAQRRFRDILASFDAGQVGEAEGKIHTMIAQLSQ